MAGIGSRKVWLIKPRKPVAPSDSTRTPQNAAVRVRVNNGPALGHPDNLLHSLKGISLRLSTKVAVPATTQAKFSASAFLRVK